MVTIAPGERHSFDTAWFAGPKLQSQLKEMAGGLELTVDYGFLTILAQPLFWLLSTVFNFVGNWGWAIIIVTALIKLVFYKLTETSGRSMAKMRKLQPRMKALQDRYKDDRQALSQAMMELYKREKVNPAAGCLPILISDAVLLRVLLGAHRERGNAPGALCVVDQRLVGQGSVLCAAVVHGRRHVIPNAPTIPHRRIPCKRRLCRSCLSYSRCSSRSSRPVSCFTG